MNTSEKKIDYINFDMVPSLVYSGAIFNCYIINYNLSDMVTNYPIDRIIQFIDKETFGDIDYKDYLEFVEDRGRDHGANEFLAKDEDFLGFLVIETEDSILVHPMWTTEISDTIWSCFEAFSNLANNKNNVKVSGSKKSNSISSINTFFKFMPLS